MGEKETAAETKEVREALSSLKKDVGDVARSLKSVTVQWTKEHPAASVGILAGVAASIGFLIGLLVGRRQG